MLQVDNNQSPPFPCHETSAEILYLLKFADKEDKFGFKDELERNQCLQWMFFWHGSGAPYRKIHAITMLTGPSLITHAVQRAR